MLTILEVLGSICFALCGIPAAYQAWSTKSAHYSWGFLLLWMMGEVLMIAWASLQGYWVMVVLNYVPNLFCLVIVGYYNLGTKVSGKVSDKQFVGRGPHDS